MASRAVAEVYRTSVRNVWNVIAAGVDNYEKACDDAAEVNEDERAYGAEGTERAEGRPYLLVIASSATPNRIVSAWLFGSFRHSLFTGAADSSATS